MSLNVNFNKNDGLNVTISPVTEEQEKNIIGTIEESAGMDIEIEHSENTGGTGINYEIGTGLKVEDNVLSVDSAKDFEGDNTRPVEAAFMQEQIGNIEILLKTI